jgi:hypothetical protein
MLTKQFLFLFSEENEGMFFLVFVTECNSLDYEPKGMGGKVGRAPAFDGKLPVFVSRHL